MAQQPGSGSNVAATTAASAPVDEVNERIGTAAEGQTFPATGVPFAMTNWTPQTRPGEVKCVAPYYAADTKLQGFRGSHFLSGSCTQDYGSFTVMPLPDDHAVGDAARASRFSHTSEEMHPYEYSVDLADSGIHAQLTGTVRAGLMRFRFAPGQRVGWVAVESNVRLGQGTVRIDAARQEIVETNPVYRIYAGAGQPAGFKGYAVVEFSRPFRVGGTWTGEGVKPGERQRGATEAAGDAEPVGAYVSLDLGADETVEVRVGTSFVSVEQARNNLHAEIPGWDFAAVAASAQRAWSNALDAVRVTGSPTHRAILDTALYHAMLQPRVASDVSGTYPKFADGAVTETAHGWTYYDDYSVWDTFRAVHPLLTILQPKRDGEMVNSLVAKGEQGGFLPIFPAWESYTTEMAGDHAVAIIADAYLKGIRGFDAEQAYRLMRHNALDMPATAALYKGGRGRRALPAYLQYGYIPLEDHVLDAFHKDEQVSRTLDYAFDDYEVGLMAAALGHKADAALFAKRSENWRKVIDPAVGFARGRHADGSWVTPFDPDKPASYITEATPYVDTFFVPQNVPGLIAWLHGPRAFEAKLDGLFAKQLYDQGNEPSHHIAYLYAAAGVPAKTQLHVHQIMTTLYKDTDDGLIGNDDAGQMSAWYVMSAMGFYPVTPGSGRYELGTPAFDQMWVRTGSGHTLHIVAKGAEQGQFYVQRVLLNGHPLNRSYLLHREVMAGGELQFVMGDQPAGK